MPEWVSIWDCQSHLHIYLTAPAPRLLRFKRLYRIGGRADCTRSWWRFQTPRYVISLNTYSITFLLEWQHIVSISIVVSSNLRIVPNISWIWERMCCAVLNLSVMSNSVTLWTVAHQASLSMGTLQIRPWSGLLCPPLGDHPNPGTEPRSPTLQWILYRLSHQRSPRILEWVAYSFSKGIFPTQELNQVLLNCRWIL